MPEVASVPKILAQLALEVLDMERERTGVDEWDESDLRCHLYNAAEAVLDGREAEVGDYSPFGEPRRALGRDSLTARLREVEGNRNEECEALKRMWRRDIERADTAERTVEQLREALRETMSDLEQIAEWSLHRNAKPAKAREAELALERLKTALEKAQGPP